MHYPARYRVKLSVAPSTGERWALIEGPPRGIGHEASTVYCGIVLCQKGLSFNSQMSILGAVAIALN